MKIANGTTGIAGVTDQMKVNAALATPPAPRRMLPPPQWRRRAGERQLPRCQGGSRNAATSAAGQSGSGSRKKPAAPTRPTTTDIHDPSGTRVAVRMVDGIDTGKNTEGQTFRASLDAPLTSGGPVVVPAGAPVTVLLASREGRRPNQGPKLTRTACNEPRCERRGVPINTAAYEHRAARAASKRHPNRYRSRSRRTDRGLAGGGKGAAIGSAAGGGAGIRSAGLHPRTSR